LLWADIVLVMEPKYEARIRAKFPDIESFPPFRTLDIPDEFEFMSADLIDLLVPAVEDALGAFRTLRS